MNDFDLDTLLEQKKRQQHFFYISEDELKKRFFDCIAEKTYPYLSILRYAACLILFLGTVALFIAFDHKDLSADQRHQLSRIKKMVELFGNESAVLTLGDDLITAERNSRTTPSNFVNFKLEAGKCRWDLALACADDDSLYIDYPEIKGTVVVSRTDKSTLVLDVDLEVNKKRVKTVVALEDKGGKCYTS